MTVRERGIRAARHAARVLLKKYGVRAPEHIRLDAIAKQEGVHVLHGPLHGARARLSRGSNVVVRVSINTPLEGARKFGLAHELGHHVLRHPLDSFECVCSNAGTKRDRDPAQRDYEAEANAFASELLMPRELIAPRCAANPPSLDLARSIAHDFGTSLPASALRVVQMTRARCAAVFSERGEVLWAPGSATFTAQIPRGKRVEPGTGAFDCARTPMNGDVMRLVLADKWFEAPVNIEIVEHSACVPEVNGVITLLRVPDEAASALGMNTIRHAKKQSRN